MLFLRKVDNYLTPCESAYKIINVKFVLQPTLQTRS